MLGSMSPELRWAKKAMISFSLGTSFRRSPDVNRSVFGAVDSIRAIRASVVIDPEGKCGDMGTRERNREWIDDNADVRK